MVEKTCDFPADIPTEMFLVDLKAVYRRIFPDFHVLREQDVGWWSGQPPAQLGIIEKILECEYYRGFFGVGNGGNLFSICRKPYYTLLA